MNHKMDFVRQSYSDIAQGKQDTILSSSPDQQALNVSVGYSEEEISLVPPAANMGLGCGNPFRIVEVKEGDTLIDLGSGAGFDCFLAQGGPERQGHRRRYDPRDALPCPPHRKGKPLSQCGISPG